MGGTDYEFEVEPVYINTKTQLVEPLSASSRTTPRDKKIPFGPVKKVTVIDEKVIKIENETGIEVFLEVQKLAPLIDKEDSGLEKRKAPYVPPEGERTFFLFYIL